ncbi:hypothetical protein BCIN_12g05560 [Botrytis cinerea B05.10]|uniref:t-SNARE coiled-coil homology domain-containing protein n=2 Tax=Botryotinia fuckeliana TaxID=40559 RepID=A0A384K0G1_BOTFB|nr:hypothetical protein BCIN_12g05560 [Botrytis cinerea B05.10]ATZ56017.1 hypothetical protein BCIN_12g05560 [Botrytis cinerea B05.10]EMR86906.1 putative snare protein syntaxin 18 ufe1 protein [Botrytis cinerea BcDW1]
MTDITPEFNKLLMGLNAPPTVDPSLTLQNIDEFLREAYRINSHIASLNSYLKDIRQSYLSTTSPPPRRTNISSKTKQRRHLTDRQREEIDAETKKLLRELNFNIRSMDEAEGIRYTTETLIIQNKYAKALGRFGNWAAGGGEQSKSLEQQLEEARLNAIKMHRDNVIWYLRQKLSECGKLQASMMEIRIMREVEKNKSNLAKSRAMMPDLGSLGDSSSAKFTSSGDIHLEAQAQAQPQTSGPQLSSEQLQMLAEENHDMVKHYQSTLDQVKTAEKSLIEISELQTQLLNSVASQAEQIEILAEQSYQTTENVGGGNKELKRASERKSTAKYVFYASCGLSAFLILWDLVI